MKNKILYWILFLILIFSMTACAEKDESAKSNRKENYETTNTNASDTLKENSTSEQETTEVTGTKENERRKITCYTEKGKENPNYPDFAFDLYADLWYWDKHDEDMIYNEHITYMNEEQDVTLQYMDYVNPYGLGGDGRLMTIIEVSKVAESHLVLDGEKFIVAKIETPASLFMDTETEYTSTDGDVCYAVVPESLIGTHEGIRGKAGLYTEISFEYGGKFTVVAEVVGRKFTLEEEQIIIEVLSSFRLVEESTIK